MDTFASEWDSGQVGLCLAYAGMANAIRKAAVRQFRRTGTKDKNRMAESKAIKDDEVLALAKLHCEPGEPWKSKHHSMLLWDYFRKQGFLAGPAANATPEQKAAHDARVKQAAKNWVAFYENGRCAYASNQAKGLAAAGICRASEGSSEDGEFN